MTTYRDAQMQAQAEFQDHEMNPERGERAWMRWLRRVEALTGLDSLDGDGNVDGYSLDQCSDWFDAGWTAERAAKAIIEAVRGMGQ